MFIKSVVTLLAVTASSVSSEIAVTDATAGFIKSTESEYDHEVTLIQGELTFHWNDADGNTLDCRLIHNAKSLAEAPSWLGVGFYNTFDNSADITPTTDLMVGSDAVIGLVANSNVQKYALAGQTVAEENGVHPSEHQTLNSASIKQHDSDDGSVSTLLTFTKELEESNTEEVRLRHSGKNVFLWAVGAPGESALAIHKKKGAFTLDLEAVEKAAERGETGSGGSGGSGGASTSDGDQYYSSIVDGKCGSSLEDYDNQFDITSSISFHWKVEGDTVKGAVQYVGEAWVGFGVSDDGKMVGSEAIIGKPADETATKYVLNDRAAMGVDPVKDTTSLKASSIKQEGGVTTLTFENTLDVSSDTHMIKSTGLNNFIYSVGASNEFAYHEHRGSFAIDLATCDGGATKSHMGAFAAHGTIATLAWAIASPFAVTVAWFRTLVPSSWIYIHVFSNVCTFFFTLIAVIVAISAMSVQKNSSHFNHPHHWVGLVLLVGVTFQVMNGFLRPPVEKRDPYATSHYDMDPGWLKLPRSPREVWYFSHRVTGISMLGMGIYQIQSGLNLFAENYNVSSIAPWYWGYVGLFAFCLISLKFWIMYEEFKARRGMEAMHVEHRTGGSTGGASENELVPVQFDMS